MMNVIRALCVVFLCIICFSKPVKAEINFSTDVVHYNWDGHNEMLGIALATTDYGSNFYYCGGVQAEFSRIENDIEVEYHFGDSHRCDITYFQIEVSLSYVASSEYEVTGSPHLSMVYTEPEGFYDPYDYAFYNQFSDANLPIFYPNAFTFLGGNPRHTSISELVLGFINSFREAYATTKSGDPDHLRVENDSFESTSCGGIRRLMKYAIVDNTLPKGKKVGKTPHREYLTPTDLECFAPGTFPEEPLTACYRSITGSPPQVELNDSNPFTDRLTAGCSHTGSNCGAKVNDHTWRWCKPTGQVAVFNDSTVLATIPSEVRVSFVKVKGQLHTSPWPKGTEFKATP